MESGGFRIVHGVVVLYRMKVGLYGGLEERLTSQHCWSVRPDPVFLFPACPPSKSSYV
jgi:hypothetical protein